MMADDLGTKFRIIAQTVSLFPKTNFLTQTGSRPEFAVCDRQI